MEMYVTALGDFNAFQGEKYSSVPWILSSYYQCCPSPHDRPITSKSQLKVDFTDFTSSPSYSSYGCLYFRSDGKVKDGWCLVAFFFFFFFFFNWKHRVLPTSPATETLFPLLFLSPLVCWINHFTPVLNKRTKGRSPLPSDYWFTNRQDVYFLTENSIWNILIMLFFFSLVLFYFFSHSPPFLDFFARRGGFLWDCTDLHPTPQTLQ